ncbi:MAG: membrane protein insertion efficiency factor YidD [Geodermatophilaceae bacterium]|nr:membrane protein insertion efficiency factor YidD [Geodermatophilaceae bacterium]
MYQRWVSPAWPSTCRFYPSCSSYAVEALQTRGPLIGLFLAVRRLVKCAPWHPGGLDPVPVHSTRSVSRPSPRQEPSLVS